MLGQFHTLAMFLSEYLWGLKFSKVFFTGELNSFPWSNVIQTFSKLSWKPFQARADFLSFLFTEMVWHMIYLWTYTSETYWRDFRLIISNDKSSLCIIIVIIIISIISSDLYASLSLPRLAFGSRNSGGGDLISWWCGQLRWWRWRWRWSCRWRW